MQFKGKFFLLIITILLLKLAVNGQTVNSLDDGWKFHFGSASNVEKDFNYGFAAIFSKSGAGSPTPGTEAAERQPADFVPGRARA